MTTPPHLNAARTSSPAGPVLLPRRRADRSLAAVLPFAPAPPRPGDPGSEWRTWDADLPAVTAAIEALIPALELQALAAAPPLHWHHHAPHVELWIDVTATPRDNATAVGLRIQPTAAALARWAAPNLVRAVVLAGAVATATLLFFALFLVEGGDIRVLMLIGVIDLAFTLSLVFGLVVLPARRLALAQAAWARVWRQTFWAALEARLSQRALYR